MTEGTALSVFVGLTSWVLAALLIAKKANMILYAIIVLVFSSPADKKGHWIDSGIYARTMTQCHQLVADTKRLQPEYSYGCKATRVGK